MVVFHVHVSREVVTWRYSVPRGVTPCPTARSLALLSEGMCHVYPPAPPPNYCAISVGMIRVSVVTFIQWKEIAPRPGYSFLLTTDHLVSRAVWRMCPTVPVSPPVVGLVQPYLILQVSIPKEARFTLELRLAHIPCNRGNPSY